MMLGACTPCSHYSDWETFWHIVAMILSRPETSFAIPRTTYVWCHFVCSGITSRSSGAALGSHRTAFCTGKNCSVTFRYCLYCLKSTCFFLGFSQVFSNCPLHPLFTPNKEAPISVSIALACMVVPNSVSHHHSVYTSAFTVPLQSLIRDGLSLSCVLITSLYLKCAALLNLCWGVGLTCQIFLHLQSAYEPHPQHYSIDAFESHKK